MTEKEKLEIKKAFDTTTWGNTTETPEEWERILASGNEKEIFRIFEHLFREDFSGEHTRGIFSREDIARYLRRLNRPYRFPHLERKRRVWRTVYLDEKNTVPGLDWVYRKER